MVSAGILLGFWLRSHILLGTARPKHPEQLSKISVLDSSLGSPNVTPDSHQNSKIRTRIDTYDGIQKSLVRNNCSFAKSKASCIPGHLLKMSYIEC